VVKMPGIRERHGGLDVDMRPVGPHQIHFNGRNAVGDDEDALVAFREACQGEADPSVPSSSLHDDAPGPEPPFPFCVLHCRGVGRLVFRDGWRVRGWGAAWHGARETLRGINCRRKNEGHRGLSRVFVRH
jgi:hypothetical protein